MKADTRTEEQRLIDEQFPPAKVSDYIVRYYAPGQEPPVMPKEVKEFDTNARLWMSSAGLPKNLGDSLAHTISKVLEHTHKMNADQLDQWGADEYLKLQQVYGQSLEEKLSAAGRMVTELEAKRPGLRQFLTTRGIGDSSRVASMLIQQAERYWICRR
jgi:hypothetical protein